MPRPLVRNTPGPCCGRRRPDAWSLLRIANCDFASDWLEERLSMAKQEAEDAHLASMRRAPCVAPTAVLNQVGGPARVEPAWRHYHLGQSGRRTLSSVALTAGLNLGHYVPTPLAWRAER